MTPGSKLAFTHRLTEHAGWVVAAKGQHDAAAEDAAEQLPEHWQRLAPRSAGASRRLGWRA